MKEPQPQPVRIQLMDDFTTPEIEELERRETKADMIYVIVSTLLTFLGSACIVLLIIFEQIWIGLVGMFLWTLLFVVFAIWSQVKEGIHTKICQAEEELLEQKIKEKENLK